MSCLSSRSEVIIHHENLRPDYWGGGEYSPDHYEGDVVGRVHNDRSTVIAPESESEQYLCGLRRSRLLSGLFTGFIKSISSTDLRIANGLGHCERTSIQNETGCQTHILCINPVGFLASRFRSAFDSGSFRTSTSLLNGSVP
jgi:hypothetical protein